MPSVYTRGEKVRLAILVAKATKQSMLVGSRDEDTISQKVKAEVERIEQRAAERGAAEVEAVTRQLAEARSSAATAKVRMRAARGAERATARQEMNEHEKTVRRLENQLRRYQ